MRVVVVDDSFIVRERLTALLTVPGVMEVVGQAQDVSGAIEAIRRLTPDAVILDLRMPGGSGIDVLRAIKHEQPAPIVLILTNYPYPQYRKQCLEAGADFFLDKSTEFHKALEILRQCSQPA